jgi:hypothetical protein
MTAMIPFSDAALSAWNWWLGWIAIIGTGLGLLSAIGNLLVGRELSSRQEARDLAREKQLTTLAEKQRDRQITPEQRAKLLGVLQPAPKNKVWITAAEGDQEAKRYASQINDVFLAAGIDSDWGGMLGVTYPPHGLSIFSSEPSNFDQANAIKRAFEAADIECQEAAHNVLNDRSFISVMVGSK